MVCALGRIGARIKVRFYCRGLGRLASETERTYWLWGCRVLAFRVIRQPKAQGEVPVCAVSDIPSAAKRSQRACRQLALSASHQRCQPLHISHWAVPHTMTKAEYVAIFPSTPHKTKPPTRTAVPKTPLTTVCLNKLQPARGNHQRAVKRAPSTQNKATPHAGAMKLKV